MVFKLPRFGTVLFVYKTLPLIKVLYGIYVLNRMVLELICFHET